VKSTLGFRNTFRDIAHGTLGLCYWSKSSAKSTFRAAVSPNEISNLQNKI